MAIVLDVPGGLPGLHAGISTAHACLNKACWLADQAFMLYRKNFRRGRMARIGEAELERLKAAVPVADLVAASGVVLALDRARYLQRLAWRIAIPAVIWTH
jgi:hypothetical protein